MFIFVFCVSNRTCLHAVMLKKTLYFPRTVCLNIRLKPRNGLNHCIFVTSQLDRNPNGLFQNTQFLDTGCVYFSVY